VSNQDPDTATGSPSAGQPAAVPAPRGPHVSRDRWLRIDTEGPVTSPLAGQPGHGRTASLRRQPDRIVDGLMEGATPAHLNLSALNAATTPTWITPRSRPGCSASAGPTRWTQALRPMRSTSAWPP